MKLSFRRSNNFSLLSCIYCFNVWAYNLMMFTHTGIGLLVFYFFHCYFCRSLRFPVKLIMIKTFRAKQYFSTEGIIQDVGIKFSKTIPGCSWRPFSSFVDYFTKSLSYCGFTSSWDNNYAVFYVQRMKNEDKIIFL